VNKTQLNKQTRKTQDTTASHLHAKAMHLKRDIRGGVSATTNGRENSLELQTRTTADIAVQPLLLRDSNCRSLFAQVNVLDKSSPDKSVDSSSGSQPTSKASCFVVFGSECLQEFFQT
jgi:hypothetical protein